MNRETSKLATAGTMNKVCTRRNQEDARQHVKMLQACVAELSQLPQNEEWNCSQVDAYYGYGDCSWATVASVVKFCEWKIADIRDYWKV
jgi:hypothetical protein